MRRRITLALALPLLLSCGEDSRRMTVVSMSPATGSARGGELITLHGEGFAQGAAVLFGDTPASSVLVQSPDTLLATTPLAYAGSVAVTVQSAGVSAAAPTPFTFLPLELQFVEAPSWYVPDLSSLEVTTAVAADFDNDGDTDILVAVKNGRARLLRNNGLGSFSDAQRDSADAGAPADAAPAEAGADDASDASGDADAGGWPSLSDASIDGPGGSETASGTWAADTRDIVVADFDEDGDLDVFLCNGSGQASRIMLNDGSGAFSYAPSGTFPSNSDECAHAALADINADGRPDIVVAGSGTVGAGRSYVRVYLRDAASAATPSFATVPDAEPASASPASCGAITTSIPELVATSSIDHANASSGSGSCSVAFTTSAGAGSIDLSFALPAIPVAPDHVEVDLRSNAPGASVQLVLVDASGERFVTSAGTLAGSAWKHVKALEPAGWQGSGDGVMELPLRTITLSFTTPDGVPAGSVGVDNIRMLAGDMGVIDVDDFERIDFPLSWAQRVGWVTAGDLDGDGDDDLVVASEQPGSESPVSLVLNEASGAGVYRLALAPSASLQALPSPVSCVVLTDGDQDGDLDLVAISPSDQDRLLLNDGRAHFFDDTPATMPLDRAPGRFADAVDVDRDRLADLVIAQDGAANRLYLQRSGGRFVDSTPVLPLRAASTLRVVPIDAEGDGDMDLFVLNEQGERSSLYVSTVPAGRGEER